MDFRADLARLQCPVLVMAGDTDPIMPMSLTETMVSSLPPHLVRFERFADGGHNLLMERPQRVLALMREFILQGEGTG